MILVCCVRGSSGQINGSNTETQYDHTSTGVFVCNSSNETKKTQIFSLEYLLVSLELNHKYL